MLSSYIQYKNGVNIYPEILIRALGMSGLFEDPGAIKDDNPYTWRFVP